jgi:hypothetical protein
MPQVKKQSREVDVCVVELSETVTIADVSSAEAHAILAAYARVCAKAAKPSNRPRRIGH